LPQLAGGFNLQTLEHSCQLRQQAPDYFGNVPEGDCSRIPDTANKLSALTDFILKKELSPSLPEKNFSIFAKTKNI
jgi:hypothetical protein